MIQLNEFTIIQNLEKYQQFFEITDKLYYVEINPTHNAPEDKISVVKSYSKENNYYWFVKKFIPSFPENLLILPINVEEFEQDDISDYEKSSESCKANIEGIAEDIIETLKIIELFKYKQSGQKKQMISQAILFKKEFIQQVIELYFEMEKLNLSLKLKYFKVIENQNIDEQLQTQFNKLHNFNDNLAFLLMHIRNQKLVNDYLRDFSQYQLKDMQNQLEELYHRYKDCTGYDFLIFVDHMRAKNLGRNMLKELLL